MYKILILGGYGNFGKRIAEGLPDHEGLNVFIAGRNLSKAEQVARILDKEKHKTSYIPLEIDILSPNFANALKTLSPDITIHTGGPFQGQDYHVPQRCIDAGSHYIDLADDRRFVCDIESLNQGAEKAGVLLVSGASSVPGLSSTVIDNFREEFTSIEEIDFCIAPGNKAERGEATLKGILSYTGHAFRIYENSEWIDTYGWTRPRRIYFGGIVGKRWLADIDIPDLELFPKRYEGVRTVRFQAGLELPILHFIMVLMAKMTQRGLVSNWSKFTKPIFNISEFFKRFGTDIGGMKIVVKGKGQHQTPREVIWTLFAPDGVGPYIPTLSTTILAKKLVDGDIKITGATPCLGLYSLEEFSAEASKWGIYQETEIVDG